MAARAAVVASPVLGQKAGRRTPAEAGLGSRKGCAELNYWADSVAALRGVCHRVGPLER